MEVVYSVGPRYIDGINLDADVDASIPQTIAEDRKIADPVTGLAGYGYEPGQKNLDGSEL